MKRLLLSMVLCLTAMPALAGTEICPQIGDMAERVMTNRQHGVQLSKMMELADSGLDGAELFKQLTLAAYAMPRYETEENQDKAIRDFRNDIELRCYQD